MILSLGILSAKILAVILHSLKLFFELFVMLKSTIKSFELCIIF